MNRPVLWMLLANGIYAVSQWLIIVVLAKHEVEFGEYVGTYTLALSICTPVYMLSGFELRKIYATDLLSRFSSKTIYASRVVTSVVAALLLIVGTYLIYGATDQNFYFIVVSMTLLKYIEAQSDIRQGNMQRFHEYNRIAVTIIIKAITQIVSMYFFISIFGSVAYGLLGSSFLWLMLYLFYDRRTSNSVELTEESATLKDTLKYSLPYGMMSGAVSANQMIPRYFVEYYFSKALVGVFGAMTFFGKIGQIFSSAVVAGSITKLAEDFYEKNTRKLLTNFTKGFAIICAPNLILLVGAYFYGKEILTIFFTPEYGAYNNLLIVLIFSFFPTHLSFFLQSILISFRKLKSYFVVTIITFILILSSSYILIPMYGILGAAYSVVITRLIQLIVFIFIFYFTVIKESSEPQKVA